MIDKSTVGIIGAGNLGANIAFFLAERGIANTIALFDRQAGQAVGKALDIMEAAPVCRIGTRVFGANALSELSEVDLLIAAIDPPSSDLSKDEVKMLYSSFVGDIVELSKQGARRIMIVSDPVDALVARVGRLVEIDRKRIIGVGCAVDAIRLKALLADKLGVSSENITAMVVGLHDERMIAIKNSMRVMGVALECFLLPSQIDDIIHSIRSAENSVAISNRRISPFYAAAAASCDIVASCLLDQRRVLSVSTPLRGEWGIMDSAISVPAVIGKNGIETILIEAISEHDEREMVISAEQLNEMMNKSEWYYG